ncbi:hypothetical protein, partial [Sedimenticola sp.]|uniref:hypothetical protein n=1 Tax=Sedimenticola sp. TaxID=1940285 RepID=UPI0025842B4C
MLRINPFLMTLLLASASYGACQQDAAEIGDIGPESQQVCQMLEGRFPESSSVIIDRQIHSGSNISI